MKMQSLYFSKNDAGNPQVIADKIAREFQCKCDKIPPAYPAERELLVCITFESGKIPKPLGDFVKNITPERAQNVGFIVVGPDTTGLDDLRNLVSANGVKVVDPLHITVKSGMFSKGKITESDVKTAVEWARKNVGTLGV